MEEITQPRASWFVPFPEYYSGDQIEKNEMGEACGTYGGEKSAYRV
jgi:hypothetical protein